MSKDKAKTEKKATVAEVKDNGPKKFIKCPKCDLNYIMQGKQKMCDICVANSKSPLSIDDDEKDLCPVCKKYFISSEEEMCAKCAEKSLDEDFLERDEDGEDWEFVDDELPEETRDEEEELFIADLEEEEEEEEEFEEYGEEDEFEYVDPDDVDEDDDDEDDDEDGEW